MKCPKCNSGNVNVQVVTTSELKRKHRGIMYWLFIGWWLELMLWCFLTLPRLIIAIFGPKRQKLVTKHKNVAICQNYGHSWDI